MLLLSCSVSCIEDFHPVSSHPCRAHTSRQSQRRGCAPPRLICNDRQNMLPLLQILLIASAVVFIAGAVATLILIPFAIRKGLPSLRKKDVAGFVASSQEMPSIVRAVLVIRKIQSVAWWSALALGMALIGFSLAAS